METISFQSYLKAVTILVVMFWNFNVLIQIRLTTSKMKHDIQYMVQKHGIRLAERLAKRLKTWDFRKEGNIRKISNLGGDIAQYPVSLTRIKLWQQQSKITQKYVPNFSCRVQFYCIPLFCSTYFVQDCLSKQNFNLNSARSPSNLNFLKFCMLSKHFSIL